MERIHVITNGEGKSIWAHHITDGVPYVQIGDNYYCPLANAAIINRLGLGKLTPQMIIQRPEIWVRMGINEGGKEVITDSEYMARLRAAADEKDERIRKACPGIDEIRSAIADMERYHEQFDRMMEDEGNDGARPPKPIKTDIDALRTQYPAAAAYLKAESWSYADHYAKSGAGKKAMDRIEAGEDHAQVIADMEAEWSDHCNKHIWD